MNSKKQDKKNPQYSKIFSNVATPMEDPEFIDDDWDPFEELKQSSTVYVSRHSIYEFEIGLNELKDVKGLMVEYVKKYTKFD